VPLKFPPQKRTGLGIGKRRQPPLEERLQKQEQLQLKVKQEKSQTEAPTTDLGFGQNAPVEYKPNKFQIYVDEFKKKQTLQEPNMSIDRQEAPLDEEESSYVVHTAEQVQQGDLEEEETVFVPSPPQQARNSSEILALLADSPQKPPPQPVAPSPVQRLAPPLLPQQRVEHVDNITEDMFEDPELDNQEHQEVSFTPVNETVQKKSTILQKPYVPSTLKVPLLAKRKGQESSPPSPNTNIQNTNNILTICTSQVITDVSISDETPLSMITKNIPKRPLPSKSNDDDDDVPLSKKYNTALPKKVISPPKKIKIDSSLLMTKPSKPLHSPAVQMGIW
jgi:hypothetical protein